MENLDGTEERGPLTGRAADLVAVRREEMSGSSSAEPRVLCLSLHKLCWPRQRGVAFLVQKWTRNFKMVTTENLTECRALLNSGACWALDLCGSRGPKPLSQGCPLYLIMLRLGKPIATMKAHHSSSSVCVCCRYAVVNLDRLDSPTRRKPSFN